ncbi:MAG: electron transfer flavoprotein subunit beta/FixA family protein [Elusimicrobia bacterium]|nr:electron transfer flavoprotein subunit beta/FixA family protein [Elusimicrobiota bacterium]
MAMGLNIVVCVKDTPTSLGVHVDSATKRVKHDGLQTALNPFDEYAVEEALRLKEKLPGSTTLAVSVGPPSAEGALREAMSRGIESAVLVSGPEFAGSDTYATSRALAAALRKLAADKPVHLVLFGKSSNDGNSGIVGPQVAAWLDWPSASSVKKIESVTDSAVTVTRMLEDGIDTLKLGLPAAVSTVKEINEPRLPSLKGKLSAKKAVIPRWTAADLGLGASEVGSAGSLARIAAESAPPSRPAGMTVEGATSAEKAAKLVDILIERKVI